MPEVLTRMCSAGHNRYIAVEECYGRNPWDGTAPCRLRHCMWCNSTYAKCRPWLNGEILTSDSNTNTLSPDLIKVAKLDPGETVKWVGKPNPRAMVQWKRYVQIAKLSSVLILVGASPAIYGMRNDPFNLLGWGLILLFVAFPWILIGMIGNYEQTMAFDTVYAITNKRALIFVGRRMTQFTSVDHVDTVDRNDEFKDLVLDRNWSIRESSTEKKRVGFLCLTDQAAESAQPFLVAALRPPVIRRLTFQEDMQVFKDEVRPHYPRM